MQECYKPKMNLQDNGCDKESFLARKIDFGSNTYIFNLILTITFFAVITPCKSSTDPRDHFHDREWSVDAISNLNFKWQDNETSAVILPITGYWNVAEHIWI